MRAKLPRLKRLLTYIHPHVIKRYMDDYHQPKAYAEFVFKELLKYLWLSQKARIKKTGIAVAMHEEMLDMDMMWHTFILFTRDYTDFSQKYFGHYLHHQPNIQTTIDLQKESKQLEHFLSFTYDNLGEETVKTWFKAA